MSVISGCDEVMTNNFSGESLLLKRWVLLIPTVKFNGLIEPTLIYNFPGLWCEKTGWKFLSQAVGTF